MTTLTHLTCEYRTNPLGIDVTAPRLGWQLHSDRPGARQTAYRVLAAADPARLQEGQAELWDSGRIESDQSTHVVYAGAPLKSRQRVYWQVTVWDETGDAVTSESAWFELGLLQRGEWQAEWIGPALLGGAWSNVPAPYLRRNFTLSGPVQSARLYITALGLYECSLNGQRAGDDLLAPGWTDYAKRVRYQVYDVTAQLAAGENVIGVILGDGWAAGRVGMGHRQKYVDRPRLLAQLEVTLADGSTVTIASDEAWRHQFGPLLENDLLMGEAYDARLELTGWDQPGYDDSEWLGVKTFGGDALGASMALVATNGPAIRRMGEVHPIADPVNKGNFIFKSYIFDLGQNMVGWVRFKGSAPAGATVQLRFAEVLDADGSLYTANLRGARATDYYTFKGEGEEVYEPRFTFHGFRYVEVRDYPGPVSRDMITGVVIYSEMAQTGDFDCSDALVNQLQSNILWSQKGNFVDVPTDCPQRDERLGWTGDIQVFARTATFNMDVAGFMTKWAQDVADAQNEQGMVPAVVPFAIPLPDGGPAWADAAIICPWTIYLCYGDRRILAENYGVMTRLMDYLLRTSPGYIRCAPNFEGWPGFGDWLSINAPTPRDLIGTAFLAYDAGLMAQIAAVLGKDEDAARYRTLFAEVKRAFGDRYLAGSQLPTNAAPTSQVRAAMETAERITRGNLEAADFGPIRSEVFNTELFTPSQTAYVLALDFDLLPEELRAAAVAELVADIERRDLHLSTGFVGSPYLPHVLSRGGRLDVAYALLQQQSWPSWLYAATQGATTIWERWDGWTPERSFQDPGMNSFNHYAYGAIGGWLYNTVAGIEIDPAHPGYKHILFRPQPGGGLTQAQGRLQTMYGEVVSAWRSEGGRFELRLVVPPNTTATVELPAQAGAAITWNGQGVTGTMHQLEAGEHRFVVG